MKKEEIVNQETLWNYCYEKAKSNVLKTWTFDVEEIENINSNEPIIFKSFIKIHDNIKLDSELENIIKYYVNPEKEINKCLNKYKSCTSIWIKRIEYFITREVI
jgi:hypothetical protein